MTLDLHEGYLNVGKKGYIPVFAVTSGSIHVGTVSKTWSIAFQPGWAAHQPRLKGV